MTRPEPVEPPPAAPRRAAPRLLAQAVPCLLAQAAPFLLALAVALVARHLVVEPAPIAPACDPRPWGGWCAARTLLIFAFATQGLGWAALAAGLAATLLRSRRFAQLALAAGAAGLVLYSFGLSAFGALLGLLVLVRVPATPRQAPA